MNTYLSPRQFRLWAFHVSHSRLLLRSALSESKSDSENVDIIFDGVFYLETTWLFQVLEISEVSESDLARLEERTGVLSDNGHKYFMLRSNRTVSYIGAAGFRVSENTLAPLDFGLNEF